MYLERPLASIYALPRVYIAPLRGESFSHARISPRPLLSSVRAWWHSSDPVVSPSDYVCGFKLRQSFEPETGSLGFSVSEHPRLNDLVRFSPYGGHDGHGVFYAYPRYIRLG